MTGKFVKGVWVEEPTFSDEVDEYCSDGGYYVYSDRGIPDEDHVYLSTRPLATLTRADCAMLYGEPDAPYLDQAHHTWLCEHCEFPNRLERQNREWQFVMALLVVWAVLFILYIAFN